MRTHGTTTSTSDDGFRRLEVIVLVLGMPRREEGHHRGRRVVGGELEERPLLVLARAAAGEVGEAAEDKERRRVRRRDRGNGGTLHVEDVGVERGGAVLAKGLVVDEGHAGDTATVDLVAGRLVQSLVLLPMAPPLSVDLP